MHVGIWEEQNVGPKINVKTRFDDPWLNFGALASESEDGESKFESRPVTPALVRKVIKEAVNLGWSSESKSKELYFVWNREDETLQSLSAAEYKDLDKGYKEWR